MKRLIQKLGNVTHYRAVNSSLRIMTVFVTQDVQFTLEPTTPLALQVRSKMET